MAARHRHGDGGRSDIGADLEDGAALKGFHKEIEKRAIGISGRSASEPVPCPRRDIVVADFGQFFGQAATVTREKVVDKLTSLQSFKPFGCVRVCRARAR